MENQYSDHAKLLELQKNKAMATKNSDNYLSILGNLKITDNKIESTNKNGDIILKPNNKGSVRILGDLLIAGSHTTINSTSTNISDSLITCEKLPT